MTETVTPLSAKRYDALLRDINKLLADADAATNERRVHVYWHIGARITRERITQKAGYHNTVLRQLSDSSPTDVRTLQRAVRFNAFYKKPPTDSLKWSHYRLLVECADATERARLRKLALDNKLSSRQLATVMHTPVDAASTERALVRPTDTSYLYSVSVHNVVDDDTLDLDVDLGFSTKRRDRFRLAQLDAPELKRKGGPAAKHFLLSRLLSAGTLVVRTVRVDLHGRYVAHLFYSAQENLSAHDCFHQGTHLNSELIEAGHAVKVL